MLPALFPFHPAFQVQLLVLSTTWYIIYYGGQRPHILPIRIATEIINEVITMLCCYHLILFSSFNLNPQLQYNTGFSFTFFIVLMLVLNLGIMIRKSCNIFLLKRKRKLFQKAKEKRMMDISRLMHQKLDDDIKKQKEKIHRRMAGENVDSSLSDEEEQIQQRLAGPSESSSE